MSVHHSGFSLFNPYVERLPAYNSGLSIKRAKEISGRQEIARLASNENPYGCSSKVQEIFAEASYESWRYPDSHCTELRSALAETLGVDLAQVVVGNGSEEIIAAISRAVLVPGDVVVTVTPSFGLHEIEPLAMGAKVHKVPLTSKLEFDIEALYKAILARPKLVFLSSPSNPVGCILKKTELEYLLSAVSSDTLFVLDEAYYEYAAKELPNSIDLLKETQADFIVLRTFSKAYGLAGLRVGYGITQSAAMAKAIALSRTPFNVNGVAQIAALAALKDSRWMWDAVDRTIAERVRVSSMLKGMGLQVSSSVSNSLFVNTGLDSNLVFEYLVKEGVVIKPWREAGYLQYIRASVGTREDNNLFTNVLCRFLTENGALPVKLISA